MIGVIGAGFVGSAVVNAFTRCPVEIVDPKRGVLTIPELCSHKPRAVFVCVPTPANQDWSVNGDIVAEVLSQIPHDILVIVKSTITPDHLVGHPRIVYNPEFLTQRTANQDFLVPDSLIFGGKLADCQEAHALYREFSEVRECPVFYTDVATASLVKYTLNCHFAAKVLFMNEIYWLHQKVAKSTWQQFIDILGADSRLGPTHLQVPGPDGEFGFGGACFPKDTKALLTYANNQGLEFSLLRRAIEKNWEIRGV